MSKVKKSEPPSRYTHITFGKISDEALEALKTFTWVKSVVLHTHGKKRGERHHWHVWCDTEVIVAHETIRKRLRKHDVFKSYKNQHEWSMTFHNSYDAWASYVMRNWSAKSLYHQEGMPPLPAVAAIPIVASASEASALEASYRLQVVRPKRSKSMKEQFVEELKEKYWEPACITRDNLADKKRELVDELTEFWENAFTTPQGSVCIQYALWTFANPSVREAIKAANYRALESFIRI